MLESTRITILTFAVRLPELADVRAFPLSFRRRRLGSRLDACVELTVGFLLRIILRALVSVGAVLSAGARPAYEPIDTEALALAAFTA